MSVMIKKSEPCLPALKCIFGLADEEAEGIAI